MFDLIKTSELDFVIRNEATALRYLLRLPDIENLKFKFEQAISPRVLARQLGVRGLHRAGKIELSLFCAITDHHLKEAIPAMQDQSSRAKISETKFSMSEVADLIGVHRTTILRLLDAGKLDCYQIADRRIVAVSHLQECLWQNARLL